jgi:hypothetical protein
MAARLREMESKAKMYARTFGPRGSADVTLARRVAKRLTLAFESTEVRFGRVVDHIARWAQCHADLSDNVFATLPGGPQQTRENRTGVFWLATDSFSTVLPHKTPATRWLRRHMRLPSATPELLKRMALIMLGSLSRNAIYPQELMSRGVLTPSGESALLPAFLETLELAAAHDDEPFGRTFDRVSHERLNRVWNINRTLLSASKPCITPFHDVDLVEWYALQPVAVRHKRALHKRINLARFQVLQTIPIHNGPVPIDYLKVLANSPPMQRAFINVIENTPQVSALFDLGALRKHSNDPIRLRILLRTFLIASVFSICSRA